MNLGKFLVNGLRLSVFCVLNVLRGLVDDEFLFLFHVQSLQLAKFVGHVVEVFS